MLRASRGMGMQPLFYSAIFPHFCANAKRVAASCLGSACEQWINGEFFYALHQANESLWVRPEKYKHDLVLFRDEQAEREGNPALVIESKVLYSSESLGKQRARLEVLVRQLDRIVRKFPGAQVFGIVTRFNWHYRKTGDSQLRYPGGVSRTPLVSTTTVARLENAFRQSSRHLISHRRGSDPYVRISFGEYQYFVDVSIEVVRLRQS